MGIDSRHQEAIERAALSILHNMKKVSGDHWRLNYHISTEAFWMNDHNGFSTFKNEYHLFYQHHPYSAEWGPMFWGHVKSKDLVFWEHLPIALAPSEEYDLDGCFSGRFLYALYTGNVWTGNDQDTDLRQTQCLAV